MGSVIQCLKVSAHFLVFSYLCLFFSL